MPEEYKRKAVFTTRPHGEHKVLEETIEPEEEGLGSIYIIEDSEGKWVGFTNLELISLAKWIVNTFWEE